MKKLLLSFMLALFAVTAVNAKISRGYYSIKNNGNGKYINVLGRKTVGFTSDNSSAPGAIYLINATETKTKNVGEGEANDLVVEVLRSQGVDLPGYAKRAMNYVPDIVNLVVEKLKLEGSGELFGTTGLDAIMDKFYEGFDENLYVEPLGNNQYRIYGKTPSMEHVVDFYGEHKDQMQEKLPKLEGKINEVIEKILQKTNNSGASILQPYSILEVWEEMVKKYPELTKPEKTDDNKAILDFYDEVLSDEAKVWDFAYYSVIPYWNRFIGHHYVQDNLDKLGDYAQYLDKITNIQPNFRYYIVADGDKIDFISQGNAEINDDRAIWTVEEREDFTVMFNSKNVKNLGTEYYTTLYVDFAYTLPEEGGKAFAVIDVDAEGCAVLYEITGAIPAQTPVLLMTTNTDQQLKVKPVVSDGDALAVDNLLKGNDYLVDKCDLRSDQAALLFSIANYILKDDLYNRYVKEYEYLTKRNAGTVNNKYFFGLTASDVVEAGDVIRVLGKDKKGLGFYGTWPKLNGNEAFIIDSENDPVKLTRVPDIDMNGEVNVLDLTALIDIDVNKDFQAPLTFKQYDHDAADVDGNGEINVMDITALIDYLIAHKNTSGN